MKKLMYIAAALLVLVGCNKKDNALNNAPEGTPFEKGQKVTLTVGTGAQQGPNRVAGVDNTTDGKIDFTWEEGDQILVKVGEATAEFTLISGEGLESGEFAGEMPAAGSTFDIQYPIEAIDLTAQEYTEEEDPIPADKMLFTATGCTLGNNAILEAQYAMLQLNLYGTDKTIGKIVFKNKTASTVESYTLTCTDGKTVGTNSEEATPFYMVVPTGSYKFEVVVYNAATTPAKICSFATSSESNFIAGKCLNMPAKEVKVTPFVPTAVDLGLSVEWATCNVGATAPEGYGDYYAWGETEPYYSSQNPLTWKTGKTNGYCWQSYCDSQEWLDNMTEWSPAPYNTNYILKSEYDAATANWGGKWRMPTKAEIDELYENCNFAWTNDYEGTGIAGCIVTPKTPNGNSIFLPAAGSYQLYLFEDAGTMTVIWSSSLEYLEEYNDKENANGLYFSWFNEELNYYCDYYVRYRGYPVRPVRPKN